MHEISVKNRLATTLATLGPIGNFPKAPGTWGSLAAIIAAPWLFLPFSIPTRIIILIAILLLGTWACSKAETIFEKKDPGCVIIDELFGQWLTILFFGAIPLWALFLAFILFRVFDILKPWPVKWAEDRFNGGLGVMLDDGVAGIYALLITHFIIAVV